MLMVAAVAQAWNTYNQRPAAKRIGRRATDLDCERLELSQTKIERELDELTGEVRALAAVLARLEERAAGATPP